MRIHEKTPESITCTIEMVRRLERFSVSKPAPFGASVYRVPLYPPFHHIPPISNHVVDRAYPPRAHVTVEQEACLSNGEGCSIMCYIAMERWNKR